MVKLDNPVRISRLASRLSQKELATQAGIARMTLVAIEEGSTRSPDHDTLNSIARVLGDDTDALRRSLNAWQDDQPQSTFPLDVVGQALHGTGPRFTGGPARSFRQWRIRMEPSATRFATLLGVARATLTGYESGKRVHGMPDTLQAGLLAAGIPISVLRELTKLKP